MSQIDDFLSGGDQAQSSSSIDDFLGVSAPAQPSVLDVVRNGIGRAVDVVSEDISGGLDRLRKKRNEEMYARSNQATDEAMARERRMGSSAELAAMAEADAQRGRAQNSPIDAAGNLVRDTGVNLARGSAAIVKSAAGITAMPIDAVGGLGGAKAIGLDFKGAQEGLNDFDKWAAGFLSDKGKEDEARLNAATGFTESLLTIGADPRLMVQEITKSLPGTILAGKAGEAAVGVYGTRFAAEAKGLGLVGDDAASFIANRFAENADKITRAARIGASAGEGLQQTGDLAGTAQVAGVKFGDYAIPALASGALDAAISLGSNKVANKLGIGDIETDIALRKTGVNAGKTGPAFFVNRAAIEAIKEGAMEELPQSTQEAIWENIAMGRPWDEGIGKAAAQGLATGMGMGGGHALVSRGAAGQADQSAPQNPATGAPVGAVNVDFLRALPLSPEKPAEQKTAAEKSLLEPKSLTALDRVDEINAKLSAPDTTPEVAAALTAERDQITHSWPKSAPGAPTTFSTETGARLQAEYALMDAEDLVTSHDENLRPAPNYPQELQPRERERAASEMQISRIVQKLDPARLGESADAATGAPIVGADGLVESGNARTIALKRVYQANGQKAADYKQYLKDNADRFGITPGAIDAMSMPVLVRVRTTPVNRAEFARQANSSTVAQMSPSEQGRSDAMRIDSLDDLAPDDSGDFSGQASRPFVRRFLARLPATEQGGMIDAAGNLSQTGYVRIRNAVLAKAYGDSPVLLRMVESMDDSLRNVTKALMRVAPEVAKTRQAVAEGALFDSDITPDLLAAVEELARLKEAGKSVEDELAQAGMFGDKYSPETRELLSFLAENIRRPKQIAEFIQRYMDGLAAAGNPNQGSLLGEATAPAKSDLLAAARRIHDVTDTAENASGGQPAGNQGTGQQDRGEPADAAGNRRGDQGNAGAEVSEWTLFPEDSGTLGVPRAEMPQLKSEHRGAFIQFLSGKGITHKVEEIPPSELKPTQAEFSVKKAASWRTESGEVDRSVLASSDGYILDGHHQWVSALAAGEPVKVIHFDAPIRELMAAAFQFPSVRQSDGASVVELRDQARKDFSDALGDLANILTKHTRAAMMPEDTPGLMPTLVKLSEAAIKAVGYQIKDVVAFVKSALRNDERFKALWNKIGSDVYRKAAEKAAAQESLQRVDDLFAAAEARRGQQDLFVGANSGPAEAPTDSGIPASWRMADNGSEWVDAHGFVRALALSSEERRVEQALYDQILADRAGMVEKYRRDVLGSGDGLLVDPDRVKELSPDFMADRSLARAVHEPSSLLSKVIFEQFVKGSIDRPVVFTAGGGGSGKSEAMPHALKAAGMSGHDGVVFDSTLSSFDSAAKKIDSVLTAGGDVVIVYTNAPLEKAFRFAMKRSRVVPIEVLARAHKGAFDTIRRLAEHYKDSEKVRIIFVNNAGELGDIHVGSIEDVPHYDYNQSVEKLYEIAKEARDEGSISQDRYQALAPRGSGEPRSPAGRERRLAAVPVRQAGGMGNPDDGRRAQSIYPSAGSDAGGQGGVSDEYRNSGTGSAQSESPVSAQEPAGKRRAQRLREGSRRSNPDLFGNFDSGNRQEERSGPGENPGGKGGDPESVGSAGKRASSRRTAGVPAGRDIPLKSGRNYAFGDDDLTYSGSWAQKARQNVEAVELFKALQAEGRQATREEQAVLAKFIGWGASEIANTIFGDKLDKQIEALNNYDEAVANLADRPYLTNSNYSLYRPAFAVLQAKKPELSWYAAGNITREMLDAAKPDPAARKWGELRDRLKKAMTPEEWKAAARSTQYAHYTSKPVVKSMMALLSRMGFKGGSIIEPGSGIGVFPGLMPAAMATNSVYTGVEFDSITGGILKQLFPDERILVESFVESSLPENYYDVGFGNPPFGNIPIMSDPKYKKQGFVLHDYFFAKTIDAVKPGGLVLFVTSRYTMDKLNDKARAYLAERSDLVGAIRLPQTAFKKNAGTEVVTDVLVLRKKVPGQTFEHAQAWAKAVEIQTADGPAMVNEYFAAHPEMVLGTPALQGSMYRDKEYTVLPLEGSIEEQFDRAAASLPGDIFIEGRGTAAEAAKVREFDFNPKAGKEGNYYVSDAGVLMVREKGLGVRVDGLSEKDAAMVMDFVGLRDSLKQAHYDQLNDGAWEDSLQALQKAYAGFTKKHGQVNQFTTYMQRVKVDALDENGDPTGEKVWDEEQRYRYPILAKIKDDPDWTLVAALENVNEDAGTIEPSRFLSERVLGKPEAVAAVTPTDALLQVLNDVGHVDVPSIAERLGMSDKEVIDSLGSLIYEDPAAGWQMADEYLSGNVRKKLKQAQEAAKSDRRYERNVQALLDVQPAARTASDIKPQIGMSWIPEKVYEDFLRDKAQIDTRVTFNGHTGQWSVMVLDSNYGRGRRDLPLSATQDWGTSRRNAADILQSALSGAPIRVEDSTKEGGKVKTTVNAAETEAANAKLNQMREAFKSWMWESQERVDALVPKYNELFNTIVPRKFDGSHMALAGASKRWQLKAFPHVKRGAWRIVQQGNVYLAHAVGSGKTAQMVISAMEQKRLGLVKKPMMVVPNHMLRQFATEWLDLYPAARLMVADETEFSGDNRRRFVSRVALSDLDGVVITQSAFKKLDLDPEFKQGMIQQQLDYLEAALTEAGVEPGEEAKKSRDPKVKQIQRQIERMEQKIEALMSSSGKDRNVRFDEMGVDFLYVDEAHLYRKLSFATQRQVKGVDPNGSDMAFDLYMKTRWLAQKSPGRYLVMASGTPVTNTMAELYTVQRFMAPDVLAERGLEEFDQWASMFGEESTSIEPDASGKYGPVTRFNKFVNVSELTQMFREFADVLTADYLASLLGDKRPKVAGGARKIVITPKTSAYSEFQENELKPRMAESRVWKPTKDEPNNPDPIIAIIGDGRLAAIDMRFMDPLLPNDPGSKLNQMIDGVIRVYQEGAGNEYLDENGKAEAIKGATQIVFSDLGFGEGVAKHRGFNARAWFEKRLRDAGIPPAQVAFMSDYKKATAKLKLFKDINAGRIRIVIGSSKNMGTGVNAQQRLLALHHLDAPWFPADLEQREGRIIRQGNKNKEVQIYAYATKGSYDEQMWSMLARKQFFIDQALSGDPNIREIEDLGEASQFEIAAAMVASDPRVLQLAGLRADLEKLSRLESAHEAAKARMQKDYDLAKLWIQSAEKQLPAARKAAGKVKDLSGDNFVGTADGKQFDVRKDFGEAVVAGYKRLADKLTEGVHKVGALSGFPINYVGVPGSGNGFSASIVLETGSDEGVLLAETSAVDPVGLSIRAVNALAQVARRPGDLSKRIQESSAKMDALAPRLSTPFPMAQMILDKQQDIDALEAEITATSNEPSGLEKEQALEDAWQAKTGAITPLFSRGSGGGMALRDLQAVVDRVSAKLKNLPKVIVLESPADLSAKDPSQRSLRDHIAQAGADESVEGATHDGAIYLFASGLAGEARAEHVLATHELRHYGLRGAIGKDLDAALQHVWISNANIRKAAAALREKNGLSSNVEAVEEVLADIPGDQLAKLRGWRRVVDVVRSWLSRIGAKALAEKVAKAARAGLSDQEKSDLYVSDLLRAAHEWVRYGKSVGLAPGETRMSRQSAEVRNSRTANQRAEDIIRTPAATWRPLDAVLASTAKAMRLDRLSKFLVEGIPGLALSQASARIPGFDAMAETVRAGMVADYGVPEAVIDRRVEMQGRMRVQLRKTGDLIDRLATLTREESRVAYEWMNSDNPQAADHFREQLPPESIKTLAEVEKLIDQLSNEAVRLGQLDADAFQRNRYAYLRRSYVKHTTELTKGEAASRSRAISVMGDQYKGRGMVDGVPMAKIKNIAPEWWKRKLQAGKADPALKGERFIRLERREHSGEGTVAMAGIGDRSRGRLLETAYWPANETIPAKYAAWDRAGIWTVTGTKGDKALVWRDFTKAERQAMGEIDEARYAIAKTLHGMIHDVETGRYLEWLAVRWAKKDPGSIDGELVDASERMRDTFAPGEWVQVPESKIQGTSVAKYGLLAGRYLPGPIWNDVRQIVGGRFKPLGDTYAAILSAWKTSKTALSPAVHLNNVMANFVMADWHDVTAGHMLKALRIILAASQKDGKGIIGRTGNVAASLGIGDRDAALEIMDRYQDSGGSLGTWAAVELQKEQLAPLLEALEKELALAGESPAAKVGMGVALQKFLQLRWPSAWDAFKPTAAGRAVTTEAKNLLALYESEDQVFRLAAWLKEKEQGASDLDAGKVARTSFLDYHINAPWVQMMRSTAFPFISFTYRAVPMLLDTAANKPWKLMKLGMVVGMLNALAYAMLGGGGDEDEERKLLPEEKAGRIFGLVPKLVRMPWNDASGQPVFLDIRRFVPVGDIFDTGSNHAAIPVLPMAVPSGPLSVLAELLFNRSQFTGKQITQETDTGVESAQKVFDHLYKAMAPNLPFLPGTYSFEGIANASKGRTDSFGRELSVTQALANSVGVKVGSYPKDVLMLNLRRETQAKMMEIDRNITALKRERQKNGLTDQEFSEKVTAQQAKKQKVVDEFQKRVGG